MSELVWSFDTASFRIECYFSPDDDVDTSFDETGETRDNLASGLWQAFSTEIYVTHKATGIALGEAYLSGSIYERPTDFLTAHYGCKGGAYFPDMVREAIKEARKTSLKIAASSLHN